MKYLFILLFLIGGFLSNAQSASNALDTMSNVKINADPRLALVVNKPVQRPFVGRVKGYRVQIYNGNDRKEANDIKIKFMKAYPGVRSYLVYNNPQFRIRVGDFKGRREAAQLQRQLSGIFNPCMIVPDVINYATPRPKTTDTTKPMSNQTTTTKTE